MPDWPKKRVFVTGSTGFIGQRLVRRLLDLEAAVFAGVAVDESSERVAGLPEEARRLIIDVRDYDSLQAAAEEARPEILFHLAAIGVANSSVDPNLALAVNAGGAINVLEAVREKSSPRVILTGTCHEYGAREAREGLDPFNAYAASKVAAWAFGRMYWRRYGLPVVTVRPFQIYGPRQPAHTLVPAAIRAAVSGDDFSMTPGKQARDFVYVDDVVAGLLAVAQARNIDGDSLDLGTGRTHSVRQVVELIWRLTGAQGRVLVGDLPYRPGVVMHVAADADRTARLTGWRASVDLEDGLRRTIDAQRCIEAG